RSCIRPPPRSPLFPYTTLFRSLVVTTGLTPLADLVLKRFAPSASELHWLAVAGLLMLAFGTQVTAAQRTLRLLQLLAHRCGGSEPNRLRRSGPLAVVSGVIATGFDATLVALLSGAVALSLPFATALGCVLGALVNFTLNRKWVFQSSHESISQQGSRYLLVSGTSALFNAGGVAVVGLLPDVSGALAWLIVRAAIFGTWTFPLFRSYVFNSLTLAHKNESPTARASSRAAIEAALRQ